MQKDFEMNLKILEVNGGMVENQLLMKFQANISGVPTVKPKVADISALGAAYAAGLAAGVWNGVEDLRNYWQMDRIWKPEMDIETRKKL